MSAVAAAALGGGGGGAESSSTAAPSALYYVTLENYGRTSEVRVRAHARIEVEVLPARLALDASGDQLPYHVYPAVMFFNNRPHGDVLYRRFSEFDAMRDALQAALPAVPVPELPEKKVFGASACRC